MMSIFAWSAKLNVPSIAITPSSHARGCSFNGWGFSAILPTLARWNERVWTAGGIFSATIPRRFDARQVLEEQASSILVCLTLDSTWLLLPRKRNRSRKTREILLLSRAHSYVFAYTHIRTYIHSMHMHPRVNGMMNILFTSTFVHKYVL